MWNSISSLSPIACTITIECSFRCESIQNLLVCNSCASRSVDSGWAVLGQYTKRIFCCRQRFFNFLQFY